MNKTYYQTGGPASPLASFVPLIACLPKLLLWFKIQESGIFDDQRTH
jgi:hypothetical protein